MASLGDLTLFINAETNRASKDIKDLGKTADQVSSKKRDIDFSVEKARNSIRDFKRDLKSLGEVSKAAFKVAKMEGVFDDEIESAEILVKKTKQIGGALNDARKPGQLLQRSFDGLAGSAVGIVNSLAKVGFALYGIQQITGVLQQAFGGLFSGTVGEAVRLQESILKTQTALASTNDVLRNGEVITEPYEAIVALTGTIEKRIDSIRQRSLDLAGVTSQEVIEVFGMVAQQVGQIGGSLQDAEDLAISFAGALGTFGIPLYQARQEIGSILRGDITTDSYLAKALGITNEDVKKAKQSTEGVIGFLNSKLATAVAGQQLAARSFSGVASNLRDFVELTGEAFGKPLVQPLIDGLTVVYDLLVGIKDEALGAASGLGTALAGASQIIGGGVRGQAQQSGGGGGTQAAQAAKAQIDSLSQSIALLAADIQTTFSQLVLLVVRTFAKVGTGLKNLAVGFASLNVEVFKSLLETVTALAYALQPVVDGFAGLLGVYGSLLQTPVVEYFASIVGQFKLLETIGVGALVKVALTSGFLIAGFAKLKAAVVGVMAFMGKAFASAAGFAGAAMQAFATALTAVAQRLGIVNPQMTALITQLNLAGGAASKAGAGMATAGGGAAVLGTGIKGLMLNVLKFNIILLAAQLAVAGLVEAFARFQRAQKHAAAINSMNDALVDLNTTFADVDENSSAAQKAMKEIADAKAQAGINKLKKAYTDLDAELAQLIKNQKQIKDQANIPVLGEISKAQLVEIDNQIQRITGKRLIAEKTYLDAITEYGKTKDRERLAEDITTRRKEYGKLEESLAKARTDFNHQAANREFQAQQDLARKNLELFQAQEQIKIRMMERRNRKLIEGEEGASAAALQALNTFISEKKRGELAIKSAEQELIIANADVEKQIANYRFDIERKIAELKKKGLEMAIKEQQLAGKRKEAEEAKLNIPDLDKPTQTVQSADLGLASADGFASAKRAAQGIQAQINFVRAAGQDLTNKDNLDRIVTSLLPNVPLEQLKDSAIKAAAMLDELGKGLDPETARANADATAKNLIMQREVGEAVEGLQAAFKRGEITADEYNAVVAAIQERYNGAGGILEQLKEEAALRIKANELLKQANQIQSLQRDAKSGTLRTDQNLIMGNAQMAAGMEFDKYRQNEILAQGRIESRRAQLLQEGDGEMSESVAKAFEEFKNAELFNAERQAEMDAMLERFQMLGEVAGGVGNAISTAFTQGFADILSGSASVQEVLGNMFQGIADSFMQMAQKIIADMIKMLVFKTLLGLFGGGGGSFFGGAGIGEGVSMPSGVGIGSGGGVMQNSMGQGFGTFGPNFGIRQFAKGGIVTGPTAAMIGEGGMNEAVVPLPNGKAIPVDFGKKGKMGGDVTSNVTVNVDQSGGSNSEMSSDDAGKLGKAIDVAVKRVIMEERRSGGMLHNGRR